MTRLENLLAAQALALTDRLLAAGPGSSDRSSTSDQAAVVTLLAHPGRSVSWLGGVLGLTSSGVTRLVDRLVAAQWVTRSPGSDARSRRLNLTARGRRRAQALLRARHTAMADALGTLSPPDQAELERLLALVVGGLADSRLPALQVCRLCDRDACASEGGECPLEHTVSADDAGD